MTFTIAEIGLNHNGDIDHAKALIDAAASAGFSSVKFQNFFAKDVYSDEKSAGTYKLLGKNIDIWKLHQSLEMTRDFFLECQSHARAKGLVFFSTPTGSDSLRLLVDLGCDRVKLSSYQLTNIPFIEEVIETQLPIILSTGGSKLSEVAEAVELITSKHNKLELLHCVVQYPSSFENANLACVENLRRLLGVNVGFSNNGFLNLEGEIDSEVIPYHCGALRCSAYEVHVTLDRKGEGVDQGFSIEPNEQRATVNAIKKGYDDFRARVAVLNPAILGDGVKTMRDCEEYVRKFAYPKLFYASDKSAGDRVDRKDFKVVRPGEQGVNYEMLDPKMIGFFVGMKLTRDVYKSQWVSKSDFV